jgi:hypothetical protein
MKITSLFLYLCPGDFICVKKIIAIILLLSFSAQAFSQIIVRLDFYINQSYIASNLCENRSKPMLHCNGRCFLAKKLRQEKKDQQNSERKQQEKSQVISSRSYFTTALYTILSTHSDYPARPCNKTADRSFAVFHPPAPELVS